MSRKTSLLFVLFVAALAGLSPTAARADMAYNFLKVTCDPVAKSATVTAFWDWNDSGRRRIKAHAKDVYELGSLENDTVTEICKFGSNEQIAFKTHHDAARTASDSFYLLENGRQLPHTFSLAHEWTLYIKQRDSEDYSLEYCQRSEGPEKVATRELPIECSSKTSGFIQ